MNGVGEAMRREGGRRPRRGLTAAFVRGTRRPGRHGDGQGLYLQVDPSGARRWVQRLVIRGKRTDLGLGSAALVSLAEARERALANRKLAREGGDPLRARREADAVPSFADAARHVHELHRPSWRNPKHAAQFIATLETYAFPRLGGLRVSDVTTADVLAALTPIWLAKPETARRVRQRIGVVLKWAVAKGWRQDNPADAIAQALPRQGDRQAHRKALPYSDVPAFLDILRASDASPSAKLAMEFAILTAARSGEARLATWDEIDLDAAVWSVPAHRMKAGRAHRVPLAPHAVAILRQARALSDGTGLVFPGARHSRPLSENTLGKLIRALGYDAHLHGFRTSFKTWAQERTNVPREVSEAALAHTISDKAEAAYARSELFEKRRRLMERWGSSLDHGRTQARPARAADA